MVEVRWVPCSGPLLTLPSHPNSPTIKQKIVVVLWSLEQQEKRKDEGPQARKQAAATSRVWGPAVPRTGLVYRSRPSLNLRQEFPPTAHASTF